MGKIKERFLQCKKNQGGFTLVEMIVVLVIIAILASLMLGALNGYIDKAKEKEVLADCRSVVLAANTVGSEVYSGKTAYRPRTQVQELSGVKQNPDVGSDTGCVVEYDSQCNVIGVACWTGDITAQYLAPNTAYNSSATAKMEIIDKGAIVVSDNWSSLNEHAKDVDENDQDLLGALNGYIDKAKEKTLTANTRSIYLAAQTVASEQYANGNTTDILSDDKNLADVDSLSGGLLTQYGSGNYAITVEAGKVISVSVTDSGIKKTCTITDGTIKIE